MSETKREPTVEELWEELERVEERLDSAAVAGLQENFLELLMRKRAIPHEIVEAKRRPIRREIARLQREQKDADEAVKQVRQNPPGQVPESLRTRVSLPTYQKQALGTVTRRQSEIGRELKEAKKRLHELEGGG